MVTILQKFANICSSLPKQQMETCGVAHLKNWQIYLHVAPIGEEEVFLGVIAPELLSCVGRRRLLKVTCGGSMGSRLTVFHYDHILGGVPRTARSGRAGHCCQTSASAIRRSTGTGAFHVFDVATCVIYMRYVKIDNSNPLNFYYGQKTMGWFYRAS